MEGLQDEEGALGASDRPTSEPLNAQPLDAGLSSAVAIAGGQVGAEPPVGRAPAGFAASEDIGSAPRHGAAAVQPAPAAGSQRPTDHQNPNHQHPEPRRHGAPRGPFPSEPREVYGALDLGTNNCRLLLARPSRRGFQVIDAFSRIIRLGEGVSQTGRLSEAAMGRTIDALRVCAQKIERHGVRRAMLVATEACRIAANGAEFLDRVEESTGLRIEMLSREGEARLAVSGCASLIDPGVDYVLVFDIGGGSSELVWLDLTRIPQEARGGPLSRHTVERAMLAWTSLSVGVVTLAETFGGRFVTEDVFEAMVGHVMTMLRPFEEAHGFGARMGDATRHLLGTSGTVTTVAGVYLGLQRYDRNRVDGCWLEADAARGVVYDLLGRSYAERIAEPCIGRDRADLVLAGCAILEALMRMWPSPRLRVADRGLREGILMQLMGEDRVMGTGRRRRRRRGQGRRS